MPLLWASHDGHTWSSVALPEMDSIAAVTGGPGGFVAVGQAGDEPAVWLSADGEAWERVAHGAFTSVGQRTPVPRSNWDRLPQPMRDTSSSAVTACACSTPAQMKTP